MTLPRPPIPRTVAKCEQYLDVLARIASRPGANAANIALLYNRLERELAEARAEESVMNALAQRMGFATSRVR
jgi:hypothetical protein